MIEDIEEIAALAPKDQFERASLKTVNVKRFKRAETPKDTSNEASEAHFLPGTHKIFIKTWGCSHNNSDSEYMAGNFSYIHCYTNQ